MLKLRQILVRRLVLAGLAVVAGAAATGCGQKGALYLPTEPAAADRATLPETLSTRPRSTSAPSGPDIHTGPTSTTISPTR